MSSKKPKPKRKRGEERLYVPIKNDLESILTQHYVSKDRSFPMREPLRFFPEKDVHFEVTANAKGRFSNVLEKELDDDALYILKIEKVSPDIMGFVRKKSSSEETMTTETMTIEVKDKPLKIKHFAQAKFYQDIFNATYGLLMSSKAIPERIIRFALRRSDIRGNLILVQYLEPLHLFRIPPDFAPFVPDLLSQFTKPL